MPIVKRVTRKDVDRILLRVEQTIDLDAANLVRGYLAMLEGQLQHYQLGNDDQDPEDATAWQGALR